MITVLLSLTHDYVVMSHAGATPPSLPSSQALRTIGEPFLFQVVCLYGSSPQGFMHLRPHFPTDCQRPQFQFGLFLILGRSLLIANSIPRVDSHPTSNPRSLQASIEALAISPHRGATHRPLAGGRLDFTQRLDGFTVWPTRYAGKRDVARLPLTWYTSSGANLYGRSMEIFDGGGARRSDARPTTSRAGGHHHPHYG
jgi:hypothetical protein